MSIRPASVAELQVWSGWRGKAGLAGAYFLATLLSIWLIRVPGGPAGVWVANAVALLVFLRCPRREWPGLALAVLVGGIAAATLWGEPPLRAAPKTIANLADILTAAFVIGLVDGGRVRFNGNPVVYLRVLMIGAGLGPLVGAMIGAGVVALSDGAPFLPVFWGWWSRAATGAVLILPAALSAPALRPGEGLRTGSFVRPLLLCLLVAAASVLAIAFTSHPFVVTGLPLAAVATILSPFATAAIASLSTVAIVTATSLGLAAQPYDASPALVTSLQFYASLVGVVPVAISLLLQQLRTERARIGESERRFRLAMDHSAVGMALVGLDGAWLRVNRAVCDVLGYTDEELRQRTFADLTHPDDIDADLALVKQALAGEIETYRMEKRYIRRDGSVVHASLAVALLRDEATGEPLHFISQIEDITAQKAAERQLKEATEKLGAEKERLRVTLDSIGDGVICTDVLGRITYMNPVAEAETDWREAEAITLPVREVFRVVSEPDDAPAPDPVRECLTSGRKVSHQDNLVLISRGGRRRSVRSTTTPVRVEDGGVIGTVLVFQDMTQARRLQRQLAYTASHDALTGLRNRSAFEEELTLACRNASAQDRQHALCVIDLDSFKSVNDRGGHPAGDAVLRQIAAEIRAAVRSHDVAARIGGDEFGLILRDCPVGQVAAIAAKIVEAVAATSFAHDGQTFRIGASAGVAVIAAGSRPADVVKAADAACYAAKASGKGTVCIAGEPTPPPLQRAG